MVMSQELAPTVFEKAIFAKIPDISLKHLGAGKLARNKAARDGTISQAAKTGIPAPHSTPTSPKPPPEKIDPD